MDQEYHDSSLPAVFMVFSAASFNFNRDSRKPAIGCLFCRGGGPAKKKGPGFPGLEYEFYLRRAKFPRA
jgi:hypothetical protein